MPVFNITVPNSSPLIGYSGSWSDTPKTNGDWQQYQNLTYHVTSQDGATASLKFNGSAIYIFGARKPTYSGYSVVLDGSPELDGSATAGGAQYNTLLYHATSLDPTKEHQVVLKNAPGASQGSSVDVDYMIVTAGDGNDQTVSQDTFWNQDDPHILYSANWVGATNPGYSNHNAQITYTQGASATVTFEGNAISLFGTVNTDHGVFSVSIDGGAQTNFDGIASGPRFQTLLYHTSGLPSGQHTLKLTNISPANSNPSVKTNGLELDTVSVSSWPDHALSNSSSSSGAAVSTGSLGADASSSTSAAPPAHRVSTGVVVGSAIAAVVGLILFALGLYLHCRRRIRYRREEHDRHNILWQQECAPVDPFRTPPASVMLHYTPESTVTSSSPYASSAYISAPPSSTTPSHTFEQQSLYHASSEASAAAVVTQGATYATNAKSEKHRLIALNAEISAAGPSGINGDNPHEDFPPPGYGQVFPSSHTR